MQGTSLRFKIYCKQGDYKVKKNFKTGLIAGLLVGVLSTAGIGSAAFFATDGFTNLTMEKNRLDLRSINENIRDLETMIDEEYLNKKDNEQLEQYIYKGLLAGLGDPYSEYYTASEYKRLKTETTGNYCGIGVRIIQESKTMKTTVAEVFEDSPALEAGMEVDDIIKAVNDVDVSTMDMDEIVNNHILGKEGTKIEMQVYRPSIKKTLSFDIERRQVEAQYVKSEMLQNKIGYISISSFAVATTNQFNSAIKNLRRQGAESLIIDLRNNPGGVLNSAVDMLASLLPDGVLVYTKDKNGKGDHYESKDGQIYYKNDNGYKDKAYPKKDSGKLELPMAVLINGDSASASEVFAQAMKDYQWATIIGTQSYGKGIVQNLIPLTDGTAVKLTVSSYYTKNGSVIQGKGVTPDIKVEQKGKWKNSTLLPPHDEDAQLQCAIKELNQ